MPRGPKDMRVAEAAGFCGGVVGEGLSHDGTRLSSAKCIDGCDQYIAKQDDDDDDDVTSSSFLLSLSRGASLQCALESRIYRVGYMRVRMRLPLSLFLCVCVCARARARARTHTHTHTPLSRLGR